MRLFAALSGAAIMGFLRAGMRIAALVVFLAIAMWWSGGSVAANGQGRLDDGAVRRGTNPTWIERDTGTVTVPKSQLEHSDVSDRHDSIQTRTNSWDWGDWFSNNGSRGTGGNSALGDFLEWLLGWWPLLSLIALGLLLSTFLILLFRSRAFQSYWFRRPEQLEEDVEQQSAKISDLPFEIEQPIMGLRAQAERLRNAGDYTKAIVYLFSYLLVELDQAGCIRLERGKTNGVYLRELRSAKPLRSYMEHTVGLFELAYFGKRQIDQASFDSLWSRLDAFEGALVQYRDGKLSSDDNSLPSVLVEARA